MTHKYKKSARGCRCQLWHCVGECRPQTPIRLSVSAFEISLLLVTVYIHGSIEQQRIIAKEATLQWWELHEGKSAKHHPSSAQGWVMAWSMVVKGEGARWRWRKQGSSRWRAAVGWSSSEVVSSTSVPAGRSSDCVTPAHHWALSEARLGPVTGGISCSSNDNCNINCWGGFPKAASKARLAWSEAGPCMMDDTLERRARSWAIPPADSA